MRFPYRGAGIAFINERGIFLGKRSKKPFYGRWAVPGGGFEKTKDNDFLDCAIRELKEETSICIEKTQSEYSGEWKLVLPFFSWHTYYFISNENFENLKLDEFSEAKWILYSELQNCKLRPFCRKEVKRALEILKKPTADPLL